MAFNTGTVTILDGNGAPLKYEVVTDGTVVVFASQPFVNGGTVSGTNGLPGNLVQVGGSPLILGATTAAASIPVAIANDQTIITSGTSTLTGSVGVNGVVAPGSAVGTTAPVLAGARAATQSPTAVTDGQAVDVMTDKIGRLINAGFAVPENNLDGFISSTGTGAVTLIAAQGTNVSIYVTDLEISNTSTTPATITLSNAAATQLLVPAGLGREVHLQTPIKIAANTALTFTTSPAVSSILVGAQGFKGA